LIGYGLWLVVAFIYLFIFTYILFYLLKIKKLWKKAEFERSTPAARLVSARLAY